MPATLITQGGALGVVIPSLIGVFAIIYVIISEHFKYPVSLLIFLAIVVIILLAMTLPEKILKMEIKRMESERLKKLNG